MQLTTILLLVVAVLAATSGLVVFVGARRSEIWRAAHFLTIMIFTTFWASGTGYCLSQGGSFSKELVFFGIEFTPFMLNVGIGALILVLFLLFFVAGLVRAKTRSMKQGNIIGVVGLGCSALLEVIFGIILPLNGHADLLFIGPVGISIVIVATYYAILRYQILRLSAGALRFFTYTVLVAVAAIVYVILSYIVFVVLFKVPNLSASILTLNFVMIVIVLCFIPVINEFLTYANSLVNTGQVNLSYIVRRLNRMATNVRLEELADFLAGHLHFNYIGFLVDGKLSGSGNLALTTAELREVASLKTPERGIWQEYSETLGEVFEREKISVVAKLNNAKGQPFGQIIVGKPSGKNNLERRDLIQLEMIINLVAALIDTGA